MTTDHTQFLPAFLNDISDDGTKIGLDDGGGSLSWHPRYNVTTNKALIDTNTAAIAALDTGVGNYVMYDAADATTKSQATAEANTLEFARQVAAISALGAVGGTVELPKSGVMYISFWLPAIITACTEEGLVTTGPPDKYAWCRYVQINGNGCTMRCWEGMDAGGPADLVVADLRDDVSFFNSSIRDLQIDGNVANNAAGFKYLFALNTAARHYLAEFDNFRTFGNGGGAGIYLGPATKITYRGGYSQYNATHGIEVEGLWGSSITDADVEQNDVSGIYVTGGTTLREYLALKIDTPYVYEQTVTGTLGQIVLDAVEGVTIINPLFKRINFVNGAKNNVIIDPTRANDSDTELRFETGAKDNVCFGVITTKTGDGAEVNNYRGPWVPNITPHDFVISFDTSLTSGNPGTGDVRYDSATPSAVTELYLDEDDIYGRSVDAYVANLSMGSLIRLESRMDNTVFQLFRTTAVPTYNTDWYTVPVVHVEGSILPNADAELGVTVRDKSVESVVLQATASGGITRFDMRPTATSPTSTAAVWRMYDADEAEWLSIAMVSGSARFDMLGTSPVALHLNYSAECDVRCFDAAADGETPELKVSGFRTGDAKRTLEIGVGVDADNTASFDGLENYLFDGLVSADGYGATVQAITLTASPVAIDAKLGTVCTVTLNSALEAISNITNLPVGASLKIFAKKTSQADSFSLSTAANFTASPTFTLDSAAVPPGEPMVVTFTRVAAGDGAGALWVEQSFPQVGAVRPWVVNGNGNVILGRLNNYWSDEAIVAPAAGTEGSWYMTGVSTAASSDSEAAKQASTNAITHYSYSDTGTVVSKITST